MAKEQRTRYQVESDRKHAGESQARLALLASIIDSSDDAIVSTTLEGVVTS